MMKSIRWVNTLAVLPGLAMAGTLGLEAQDKGPMAKLVDTADVIAIGTAQVGPITSAGASTSLLVSRYIKGAAASRLAFNVPVRPDPRTSSAARQIGCSVWFLSRSGKNLTAVVIGPVPGLGGFYYSVPSCDAPRLQRPLDTIISVLGTAVEASQGKDPSFSLLFRFVNAADSPLVKKLTVRFRNSSHEDLQLLGLTWAILQGDAAALSDMHMRLQAPRKPRNIPDLPTALVAYANPDPRGIAALGGISGDPEIPLLLRRAATYALRNIHTKAVIPHLARLLDDKDLRQLAVSGFIYYRLSVPNLAGAAGRQDIPVEKATREYAMSKPNPVEKEAMRLGEVKDPAESQRIADYWKSWYQANQAFFNSQTP